MSFRHRKTFAIDKKVQRVQEGKNPLKLYLAIHVRNCGFLHCADKSFLSEFKMHPCELFKLTQAHENRSESKS